MKATVIALATILGIAVAAAANIDKDARALETGELDHFIYC